MNVPISHGSDPDLDKHASRDKAGAFVMDFWAFADQRRSTCSRDDRAKSLRHTINCSVTAPDARLKPNDVSIGSKTALPERSTFAWISGCQHFVGSVAACPKRCRVHLFPRVGLLGKFLQRSRRLFLFGVHCIRVDRCDPSCRVLRSGTRHVAQRGSNPTSQTSRSSGWMSEWPRLTKRRQ